MKNISYINELKGKRCDVLGAGVSNLPLIDILISAGAAVTVRDKKDRASLGDICDKLEAAGVRFIFGDNYLDGIDGEIIFRSPGIRPDLPEICRAVRSGALLTSEMELFLALTSANVIAITGSDGKTTSTTLTHLFLKAQLERAGAGVAYVGGNIGKPLLSEHTKMTEKDYAVLELSSFQLMTASPSPLRAAITNITPNHLNWHVDMNEYIEAKLNVFGDDTLLVLNAENDITRKIAQSRGHDMILFSSKRDRFEDIVYGSMKNTSAIFLKGKNIIFSDGTREEILLKVDDIKIPGMHNVENYMTAIGLTYGLVDTDIYTDIAKSFGGVEHRLEFVRELDGVKYYNSSIDSSPTRTAAALSALSGSKVVICGGYDKNIPFAPLASALCETTRCVVLTGATAAKIKEAIISCPEYSPEKLRVIEADDFDDAIRASRTAAHKGESVLLSPACASFDRFSNFEERGAHFKDIVNALE